MGKKVKEYKAGDFIFAKVKGYPAWPARVQKLNGKKYFVYFYGTGETANLSPNMIFDYVDNKDKFLTKTVKRRDFNDGVKQIEHDFANKVPLEQVIGVSVEAPPAESSANDSANDSATNDTLDDTGVDTTVADETIADDTTLNATQNDTAVEDSDDTGNLVIDEGKQKQAKRAKNDVKAKETPVKPVKEPKTPRGKGKKDEPAREDDDEAGKKEEEIVSRSGRKIRPKRYMDEQTEENTTLPLPAPKKRRGGSPISDKEKDKTDPKEKEKVSEKNIKHFNAVTQSELEDLKEPFKPEDAEKENILIAYLPSGQYIGIKLFQSRPNSFKNESTRLQWDKQAALNAVTLKMQLEKGHITSQSVLAQLVTDLNLTDEEKATLDKERETEEKKSRVQFLKTEMKLIELDAKIKTCLSLEKADTDMCLKLLDDLMGLDIKPLMLLKHPTCLETIKRMRAYVGNTPSWELTESAALVFTKQAHRIRKQADCVYKKMKDLFTPLEGLSFWEFFTNRVLKFKKATSTISADELLEMIHEPLEMSVPSSHDMKEAVAAANEAEQLELTQPEGEDTTEKTKKKSTPVKSKKDKKEVNSTSKLPLKRQSSRKLQQEEKEKETTEDTQPEAMIVDSEATKPDEEVPEQVDENREKTPEKSPEPEKETESPPRNKEAEKEENGEVEKDEGEKVVENDAEKVEKFKEKEDMGEPRAKRSRESKKTEPPPPRSPAKRKSKF